MIPLGPSSYVMGAIDMPEFVLDTTGRVLSPEMPGAAIQVREAIRWRNLDAFTQGYITALFFTQSGDEEGELGDAGFADLGPEALASILKDCEAFQATRPWADVMEAWEGTDEEQGGHDFWLTRNGHGAGFSDGDWPEPHGDALHYATRALFNEVDTYLGDDGKVYLS